MSIWHKATLLLYADARHGDIVVLNRSAAKQRRAMGMAEEVAIAG